jgi:hypothetical protein
MAITIKIESGKTNDTVELEKYEDHLEKDGVKMVFDFAKHPKLLEFHLTREDARAMAMKIIEITG